MNVKIKRVYEPPSRGDGRRVLVDRLWPRGVSKDDAALDEWPKELAPSDELRKWFGHDSGRWDEFRRKYTKELVARSDDVAAMVDRNPQKTLTLLYAAKDTGRNNAAVLKEFIESNILEQ